MKKSFYIIPIMIRGVFSAITAYADPSGYNRWSPSDDAPPADSSSKCQGVSLSATQVSGIGNFLTTYKSNLDNWQTISDSQVADTKQALTGILGSSLPSGCAPFKLGRNDKSSVIRIDCSNGDALVIGTGLSQAVLVPSVYAKNDFHGQYVMNSQDSSDRKLVIESSAGSGDSQTPFACMTTNAGVKTYGVGEDSQNNNYICNDATCSTQQPACTFAATGLQCSGQNYNTVTASQVADIIGSQNSGNSPSLGGGFPTTWHVQSGEW